MANETIMPVPNDVVNPQQLRLFLTNLIIRLDIVIGYRGDDGLLQFKDKLTGNTPIAGLAELDLTISDPPTQAEVQAVVTKVNALVDKQNETIALLRRVNIVGE